MEDPIMSKPVEGGNSWCWEGDPDGGRLGWDVNPGNHRPECFTMPYSMRYFGGPWIRRALGEQRSTESSWWRIIQASRFLKSLEHVFLHGSCAHSCLHFLQFSHATFSGGSVAMFSGYVILFPMSMDGAISSAGHEVSTKQMIDVYAT